MTALYFVNVLRDGFACRTERDSRFDPVPVNQANYTAPFSISGHPALSLPAGLTKGTAKGLPVGLQLVGRHNTDFELIALAQTLFECLSDK